MRRAAIEFTNAGFAVIPLRPGDKKPLVDKGDTWKTKVCRDALDVLETWPGDECNVGIVTGGGFFVLDVDVGKGGAESFARLQAEIGPLPATRRVRTQSGGWHYYFATSDGDVSNAAKNLQARFGDGLDIRGLGGYVVAPGSVVNGRPYVLECDGPIAPVPPTLRECLSAPPVKSEGAATIIGETDKPADVERARAWLEQSPEVFEGGRDNAAYEIACRFLDFGAFDTCQELLEEWNEKKCNPSLTDDDIERIVSSAKKNRQAPIGRDSLFAGFEPIAEPPPLDDTSNPFSKHVVVFDRDEAAEDAEPPRPWIAHRRMIRGKLTSLVAPGSIGKSLLTLQWACAVAMGNGEWCGLDVREKTNVLVVNGEDDVAEMNQRLGAVIRHFRLDRDFVRRHVHLYSSQGSDADFALVKRTARGQSLADTEHIKYIVDHCKRHNIGAVIFDPLVEFHEASENDNSEMSRVVKAFRKIAADADVSVTLVHHSKKPPQAAGDSFAGSMDAGRGASALVNGVRISMTLFNMSKKDAERFGVPSTRSHLMVRLDDAKANLFLASPVAQWFERKSVRFASGEEYGVLQPVELIDRSGGEVSAILNAVADLVAVDGGGVTVNALAGMLAGQPFFSGVGKTAIKKRIVAALEMAGDATYNGKKLSRVPNGESGGTVFASLADE